MDLTDIVETEIPTGSS